MAGLTDAKNMNDAALKPRMLRTILQEDLPDEKRPLTSPSSLSRIVSLVQTHHLLSESLPGSTEASKLVQQWESAVDDWIARLLSLLTTTTPDKCWAGICLLGLSCQECRPDRFLASYSIWFDKLIVHIQSPPADSQFVKVAACSSITDLITRLGEFPNMKKEGTSLAGKIVQAVLKLLNDDCSEAVWGGAVHLLCAIINIFPSSLHRHYDSAEATVASKILSGKCSVNLSKELAHCLALLPKSRGDEDSWLSMVRKILLLVNAFLTEIFQGVEEDTRGDEGVRLLITPGEVSPPTLWGQKLFEYSPDKERKRFKISSICMLMLSCCSMLTNPYPVRVTVPVRSLLALIERVLMVDGSLSYATSHLIISAEQEFVCSELSVLHSCSLDLLSSVITGIRSQLLPHAAYTVRLVKEYFKRCELPELRIKVYSITKMLFISMGVGGAIYLAQEVVNNSILDLDPISDGVSTNQNSKAPSEALLQSRSRKRKHGTTPPLDQQHDRILLEMAPQNHPTTPTSLKIAALEALEALLTVGGSLKSDSWRAKVDNLLITMATDACKGGWVNEKRFLANGHTSIYADFQIAALRALLASLLSPSRVRPPHLAQALELFNKGRRETGTKVSEFCAHALLTLEVLIHPRTLPLVDPSTASSYNEMNNRFSETMLSGGQKHNTPFSGGMQELGHGPPDSDDDLYEDWLNSSKETKAPGDSVGKSIEPEVSSEILRVLQVEPNLVGCSSDAKIDAGNGQVPTGSTAHVETRQYGDEIMADVLEKSAMQLEEPSEGIRAPEVTDNPKVTEKESTMVVASDTSTLGFVNKEMGAVEVVMADQDHELASGAMDAGTTSLSFQKGKSHMNESDDDSSIGSIPDIVDVEPDSDSD